MPTATTMQRTNWSYLPHDTGRGGEAIAGRPLANTYGDEDFSPLSAIDLRQEAAEIVARGETVESGQIILYDEAGYQQGGEKGEYLYSPADARLGIAWGTDATWADVGGLKQGIEMYINDPDEWEARS